MITSNPFPIRTHRFEGLLCVLFSCQSSFVSMAQGCREFLAWRVRFQGGALAVYFQPTLKK